MSCVTCEMKDRTFAKGEDKRFAVTVYESDADDADVQNLTGLRLILLLSVTDGGEALSWSIKDTDNVDDAEITDPATGVCEFIFKHGDTSPDEVLAGSYFVEVWLQDEQDNRERILSSVVVTLTATGMTDAIWGS